MKYALLALACAGCSPALDIGDAAVTCASADECPSGYHCNLDAGLCIADNSSVDLTPPLLNSATATDAQTLQATFSKEMDLTTLHVTVTPALEILTIAAGDEAQSVKLTTDLQIAAHPYLLHVDSGHDTEGNAISVLHMDTTFAGFGSPPDTTPPKIVSPAGNQLLVQVTTVGAPLSWTSVDGARRYVVQASTDADFDVIVAENDDVRATSTHLVLPAAGTYFWRVRADVTVDNVYSDPGTFIALDDAVRVYCASAGSCLGGIGTSDDPAASIGIGISLAERYGVHEVWVAGPATYPEVVHVPDGISIRGGYTPTFSERDLVANATTIATNAVVLVDVQKSTHPMEIDGLTIRSAGSPQRSTGIQGIDVDKNLTIRNCDIGLNSASAIGIGIFNGPMIPEDAPLLTGNTVLLKKTGTANFAAIKAVSSRIVGNPQLRTECTDNDLTDINYAVQTYFTIFEKNVVSSTCGLAGSYTGHLVQNQGCIHASNNATTVAQSMITYFLGYALVPLAQPFPDVPNPTLYCPYGEDQSYLINNTALAPAIKNEFIGTAPDRQFTAVNNLVQGFFASEFSTKFWGNSGSADNSNGTFSRNMGAGVLLGVAPTADNDFSLASDGNHNALKLGGYKPTSTTPDYALHQGKLMPTVTDDIDGNPRTCPSADACVTLGAYERDP